MINKTNKDHDSMNNDVDGNITSEKKPDENGGFYFSSHIKIFDPETQEVLLQKRGDV